MMKSLKIIHKVLSYYQDKIKECSAIEDEEMINRELRHILDQCVERYPHLLLPFCNPSISGEDAAKLFEQVLVNVRDCNVPFFPTCKVISDVIGGKVIESPVYEGFDCSVISVDYENLSDLLLNILLSMLPGRVNLTFLESGKLFSGDFFYQNISPKLYSSITNDTDIREYFDKLKDRLIKMQQVYGNYPEYCNNNQVVPVPYEIIVLPKRCDSGDAQNDFYQRYKSEIALISQNGQKAGIYMIKHSDLNDADRPHGYDVIVVSKVNAMDVADLTKSILNIDCSLSRGYIHSEETDSFVSFKFQRNLLTDYSASELRRQIFELLYPKFEFKILRQDIGKSRLGPDVPRLIKPTYITENNTLLQACIEYLNKAAQTDAESAIIKQDYTEIASSDYDDSTDSIVLPIGKANGEVVFKLDDTVDHAHAFILGQSGSGKSVFLHNIVVNAMLKYAPEDLMIYLLDFKLGGVEFNRYQGVKHVKSLLVDNSDQQITLEIFREIRDYMAERSKKLRHAGVKDIVEYNRLNAEDRIPQVMIVVDECHAMFNVGSNIPRVVSSEIADIVTLIAKEGRSQGVHLIMATQTLAGAEINPEILNNISVHYLLKCAMTDSERLVEHSSDITGRLSTGQIFCHNKGVQTIFQSYYIDSECAKQQIELIKQKSEGHATNERFYFNGMQLFDLEQAVSENKEKICKYPLAYLGKNISIRQNDLNLVLKREGGDNILVFGQNDQDQTTRATMNVFFSLLYNVRSRNQDYVFKVINCLSDDSVYTAHLELLESKGYCEIIEGKKSRGQYLKQLAENVLDETAHKTILFILGQEKFRELKLDMEFEVTSSAENGPFGFTDKQFSSSTRKTVKSFRNAMEVILDKGAEIGVHIVMQLDKPSNFLFSDYVSPKQVYHKFKHLIMLKSDESVSRQLYLNDSIRLETLSKDPDRLRAYYYSDDSGAYTLYTPYKTVEPKEIINLLENI